VLDHEFADDADAHAASVQRFCHSKIPHLIFAAWTLQTFSPPA
jgi:hypothetical protein